MLRHTSSIQSVLVYATFFTISLMIHMVVVWPQPSRGAGDAGSAEGAAPVASERSAEARPPEGASAPRSKETSAPRSKETSAARSQGATEVLK